MKFFHDLAICVKSINYVSRHLYSVSVYYTYEPEIN